MAAARGRMTDRNADMFGIMHAELALLRGLHPGALNATIAQPQSPSLARALSRLLNGKDITLQVVGGSAAAGAGG